MFSKGLTNQFSSSIRQLIWPYLRSDVLKSFIDQQRKTDHLDKAVLAFKVGTYFLTPAILCSVLWNYPNNMGFNILKAIDKDNSGSITVGELSQLSSTMSKRKCEALMKKLDVDGDGKITLEEFKALFAHANKWYCCVFVNFRSFEINISPIVTGENLMLDLNLT